MTELSTVQKSPHTSANHESDRSRAGADTSVETTGTLTTDTHPPVFRYTSRRQFVARNNLIVNLVIQTLCTALVIITVFVGSWDCSTPEMDRCDSMLRYHVGDGQDEIYSFGFSQAQTSASVAYICMAAGGVVYALVGIGATLQKIKNWNYSFFNFLLSVRIAHWIYLAAILSWFFVSGNFLNPLQLGWCPYTLFACALVVGYLIGLHLRYWVNKLEQARIIDELLGRA